jgi:DNA polymerase III delta subunit
LSTLVLIDGDEEFLKERAAIDEAAGFLNGSPIVFHLPEDLPKYLEEIYSGIDSQRSFVLFGVKDIPPLPPGPSDLLVAVSDGKKKLESPIAKRSTTFTKLKSFDDKNEVVPWILKEGNRLNIDLSRVASALFVNCGEGLRKLSSEIRKLAVLTPPGGVVTPEVAKSVMCFSAELRPGAVVSAVCEGNPVKALAIYDKLQEAGDETGWILTYMQRHVLQHLRIFALKDSGLSPDRCAEIAGVHPFLYRKAVRDRHGLWTMKSLALGLRTLCELEVAHKTGDPSVRVGLESEIVRLSEEAKNVRR